MTRNLTCHGDRRSAYLRRESVRRGLIALLATVCVLATQPAEAQTWPPAVSRWQSALATFAAADRERPPGQDGVLFVGSSTIRLWSRLAEDFSHHPVVINRGFGGSTLADCQAHARQLVVPYRPRHVLVYAGENDLAEGRTPLQVRDSFEAFVKVVRAELPGSRISYISVKPSPLRVALLNKVRETNALIAEYVATVPNAEYIDTFTPMLDASGLPRAEFFRADMLHLNDAGYRLWQTVIGAHLPVLPTPAPAPMGAPLVAPATGGLPLTPAPVSWK